MDHARRPMTLTAAGESFQRRIAEGLRQIRLGVSETAVAELEDTRSLRLSIVEEFESTITPQLAAALTRAMPQVRLALRTEPSHQALANLAARRLDLAIVTEPAGGVSEAVEHPLLRDPFVIAAPRDAGAAPEDLLAGKTALPFLRYNPEHIIGRLVLAHLRRRRIMLDERFEIDSNQTIMALIAAGRGWSITTATGYLRAHRFRDDVALLPLPGPAFARTLTLCARPDGASTLTRAVAAILLRLIASEAVAPLVSRHPWLSGPLEPPRSGGRA